ncbi:hypothetical protein DPMN_041958 [Dreissena polymorpha]|uniref:Uncharacterized protein n=2 Tax=Dreissena polymorpha TaxID=45954 RepID=A0A9D4HUC3_DREPO|nr:hypothetical protein DPMN_041958 [Dreissena polymorpha]
MEEAAKDLDIIVTEARESLNEDQDINSPTDIDEPSSELSLPIAWKTFISVEEAKEMEEVFRDQIKWAAECNKSITR